MGVIFIDGDELRPPAKQPKTGSRKSQPKPKPPKTGSRSSQPKPKQVDQPVFVGYDLLGRPVDQYGRVIEQQRSYGLDPFGRPLTNPYGSSFYDRTMPKEMTEVEKSETLDSATAAAAALLSMGGLAVGGIPGAIAGAALAGALMDSSQAELGYDYVAPSSRSTSSSKSKRTSATSSSRSRSTKSKAQGYDFFDALNDAIVAAEAEAQASAEAEAKAQAAAKAKAEADAKAKLEAKYRTAYGSAVKAKTLACPVSKHCGACQHVGEPYVNQLVAKDRRIAETFAELLKRPANKNANVFPIIGMDDPYFYRSKVISPFAPGRKLTDAERDATSDKLDRHILTGMYREGSHELINTDNCLVENAYANHIIKSIAKTMAHFGVPPYKEDTGAGFIRHAVIRMAHNSGEVLVTLVTNGDEFKYSKSFCNYLLELEPSITTIVQNVNTRQTNVIMGDVEHVLYGPGFILDTLCGLRVRISSQSFYQVNNVQTEVLYKKAMELAQLDGSQPVIDAYCGTGTIGLVAATNGAARVVGVESVESAVKDARQNASHNGIENATFVVADAAEFLDTLSKDPIVTRGQAFDAGHLVLFLDPPRAGASDRFIFAALQIAPERIVYISCNPDSQARDVATLCTGGYRIETIQPVDMFPHTDHIENICVLKRIEPDEK